MLITESKLNRDRYLLYPSSPLRVHKYAPEYIQTNRMRLRVIRLQ